MHLHKLPQAFARFSFLVSASLSYDIITNICYVVAFMEKLEPLHCIIVIQGKLPNRSILSFPSMKITHVPVIGCGNTRLCSLPCSGNVACWSPSKPES